MDTTPPTPDIFPLTDAELMEMADRIHIFRDGVKAGVYSKCDGSLAAFKRTQRAADLAQEIGLAAREIDEFAGAPVDSDVEFVVGAGWTGDEAMVMHDLWSEERS